MPPTNAELRAADVRRTVDITRMVNALVSEGVDPRAVLVRLVTDAVQLETRLRAQYPDTLGDLSVESIVEAARQALTKEKPRE